jgi:tetratricopeptide (TPR) repeat protein
MNADELFDQGIIEFNLGNFKKAVVFFDGVLESEPRHVMALIKKGNVFGKFGRYADAISLYDMALQADRQNPLALVNKGLALHYLQKYAEAISCYDEALLQKPGSPTILYNKASSLIRQGNTDEGLDVLERVIKMDFSYKYKARSDIDFDAMQNRPDFGRLVHT